MRKFLLGVISSGLLLSGCATPGIQSSVRVFQVMPPLAQGDSIAVVRGDIVLPDTYSPSPASIESATYVGQLAEALKAHGYRISSSVDDATYVASFSFGIGSKDVTTTDYVPQIGVTGYSASHTTGTVSGYGNMATVNTTTTNTPTYGVTGYRPVTDTTTLFGRYISLDIYRMTPDRQRGPRVYEATLVSSGTCGSFSKVMPILIQTLVGDFPGPSGERKVEAKWDGEC